MPTYRRSTRIPAPIEDVWTFHSTVDGLKTLTPDWMRLQIESVIGPDGDPDPEVLLKGTRINMAIRPFAIGPRQRWVSQIVDRSPTSPREPTVDPSTTSVDPPSGTADRSTSGPAITDPPNQIGDSAYFVDDMRDGPFRRWVHTHAFYAENGATRLVDIVEYQLPYGMIGDVCGPFAKVGFEGMFRDRHQRTIEHFRTLNR